MKFISIEDKETTDIAIINTNQITSIIQRNETVFITLACGKTLQTKFTEVGPAIDYIQRAPSFSYNYIREMVL